MYYKNLQNILRETYSNIAVGYAGMNLDYDVRVVQARS